MVLTYRKVTRRKTVVSMDLVGTLNSGPSDPVKKCSDVSPRSGKSYFLNSLIDLYDISRKTIPIVSG